MFFFCTCCFIFCFWMFCKCTVHSPPSEAARWRALPVAVATYPRGSCWVVRLSPRSFLPVACCFVWSFFVQLVFDNFSVQLVFRSVVFFVELEKSEYRADSSCNTSVLFVIIVVFSCWFVDHLVMLCLCCFDLFSFSWFSTMCLTLQFVWIIVCLLLFQCCFRCCFVCVYVWTR